MNLFNLARLFQSIKGNHLNLCVVITDREDPLVWTEVYERGKQMAPPSSLSSQGDQEPYAGRKQNRANVRAATSESVWQRAVHFPLVDHLVQEMYRTGCCHGRINS